jgi:hypothetical protein
VALLGVSAMIVNNVKECLNFLQNDFFVRVLYGTQFASHYKEILQIRINKKQCKVMNEIFSEKEGYRTKKWMYDTGLKDSNGRHIWREFGVDQLWVEQTIDARGLGQKKGYICSSWQQPEFFSKEELDMELKYKEMLKKEGVNIS